MHCFVVGGLQLDLPKMMEQKDKAVHGLTSGIAALFKGNKVFHCNYICISLTNEVFSNSLITRV